MSLSDEKKHENTTLQDPRRVLKDIVKEIKESNSFGKREAIFLLLEELLNEQLLESK